MGTNAIATTRTIGESFLIDYDAPRLQLIRQTYAKDATPAEFELLLYMSKTYGLDILTRKIWCVKYGTAPAQIFAGRDGFLEIAHGNPQFDGMETSVEEIQRPFTVQVVKWVNNQKTYVPKTFDSQFKATTLVWRKDKTRPFKVEVYEDEYSTGIDNWEKKRRTMISKVAESQCLRKAFSISGMYAPEETGEEGQGPDIQTATVVEERVAPLDPKSQEAKAEDAEEDEGRRLKFLRGKLNQALLTCKDEKASKKVRTEFQQAHGKGMWEVPTGHDADETFLSLAMQHEARIKSDVDGVTWNQRMTACASLAEFEKLQAEYIDPKNKHLETTHNDDLINEKGAFFGAAGYEKEGQ